MTTPSVIDFVDGDTTPAAPTTGKLSFYAKNGTFKKQTSGGVETNLVPGVDSFDGRTGAVLTDRYDGLFVGASKVYSATLEIGSTCERSNGGAAMTDTLPTLAVGDNGWTRHVHNVDTAVAATITFSAGGAAVFPNGATSYVLNFGCRQTFVWTGTKFIFGAGNGNIVKISPGTVPVTAGNLPQFGDTTGRNVSDSGQSVTSILSTAASDATTKANAAQASAIAASVPTGRTLTGTAPVAIAGVHTAVNLGADRTISLDANGVTNAFLATMAANTFKGSMTGTGNPVDFSNTQALQALLSAANKWTGVEIFVTLNPYSNLVCDGVTDDSAALIALWTNAPDGSTLVWPGQGATMRVHGALSFPSGKHFRHRGQSLSGGDNKTRWLQTNQTADHFTANDWFSTFEGFTFTTNSTTTTTNGQALTSGTVLNIAAINTALVAPSGSINVGSSAGWQTLTYSAITSTTVTLSSTGTGTTVAGIPLVFKTAGAAVNAGNFVGIDMVNCGGANLFQGYSAAGSTANQSVIDGNSFLNTIDCDVLIDAANWNGIINENTADCTTNSRTRAHCEVRQCGSITTTANQWIRGNFDLLLGSLTTAYPAGVFGFYSQGDFYDNAGTDAIRIQGISAVQRVRFLEAWMSSAAGMGLNLASTAATLPTGIFLEACDIFANGVNGIGGNGSQDLTVSDCNIAANATAGINSFVARLYAHDNRIGPISGFGANGTGIILPIGAYTTIKLHDNDLQGNTTAFTDNSTSATFKSIHDNAGINPKGAVTTPGVPTAGTTVTNTTGYRVTVFALNGATAPAAIVVNGVSVAQINKVATTGTNIITLEPGGTIAFTTTTITSWTWVGN